MAWKGSKCLYENFTMRSLFIAIKFTLTRHRFNFSLQEFIKKYLSKYLPPKVKYFLHQNLMPKNLPSNQLIDNLDMLLVAFPK